MCKAIVNVDYHHSLDTQWIVTIGLGYTNSLNHPYQFSRIIIKPLDRETPTIKTWSRSELLLSETWCNRVILHDSWDIISSTFNDDILEILNQYVAIHLATKLRSEGFKSKSIYAAS